MESFAKDKYNLFVTLFLSTFLAIILREMNHVLTASKKLIRINDPSKFDISY